MQHHAADQLDVEMALPERALGRLTHGGEGRNQDVVERLALGALMALTRDWYPLTRRSLAEPKNLRASAPIMCRVPVLSDLKRCRRHVVHLVAYQLTVTRCGAVQTREHPQMSGN
jgi:hypothetical protein